ncbi:DUF6545 domain-containing protein [Streptomyces sp. NPDC021100]|uniref:DUF6545 domain-containing protein n=1 Tax=Streptomyces sp. NPDC021100 TaxID=3365114 RepID=UPI00379B55AC
MASPLPMLLGDGLGARRRPAGPAGRPADNGDDTVSTALALVCAALVAAGGSAAVRPALRHWWWFLRTYRALTPLWSAFHRAFPTTPLPARRHPFAVPAGLSPRRLRFALYRRVIEIHDGLLLLRPHLPAAPEAGPGTAGAAVAGPGNDDAHTAATRIAHALRDRTPPPGPPPGPLPLRPTTGTDPAAAQLAAVSRAFARLPAAPAPGGSGGR